jgi:hypothetical protein
MIFLKNYWEESIFWLLLVQSGKKWSKVVECENHFITFVFTSSRKKSATE